MSLRCLRSYLTVLACILLAACGEQPPTAVTPPPTSAPATAAAQATQPTPSLLAPSTATPTAVPISPTAQPSATSAPPTATSGPRATATPLAPTPTTATPETAYVFPVRSKGKVTYGKAHHDYPATDIFCPIGSEFVAVTNGVVDYVSREDTWDPQINDGATRGGLSVAIIGDDGVRYYGSHLSQVADGIAPGVRVAIGQVLGLTGKSGDAAVTASHLHFGISHPTRPDDWATRRGELSPYPYLRAWQRGENLAPHVGK